MRVLTDTERAAQAMLHEVTRLDITLAELQDQRRKQVVKLADFMRANAGDGMFSQLCDEFVDEALVATFDSWLNAAK